MVPYHWRSSTTIDTSIRQLPGQAMGKRRFSPLAGCLRRKMVHNRLDESRKFPKNKMCCLCQHFDGRGKISHSVCIPKDQLKARFVGLIGVQGSETRTNVAYRYCWREMRRDRKEDQGRKHTKEARHPSLSSRRLIQQM